jgi:hypothetical protein
MAPAASRVRLALLVESVAIHPRINRKSPQFPFGGPASRVSFSSGSATRMRVFSLSMR